MRLHPRSRLDFRPGHRIDSLKALLAEDWDAIFVGSGAPRGRDLDIPGRTKRPQNIHIGIDWLSSVSFGHITKIGRRVIVLGGGNTAMDCCRSSRRLGGEEVTVVVRSGFEEMKASPWEKEDAMHEGIPILNFLVPKEFTHDNGRLTGITFEKVKAEYDAKGRRSLVPSGEPDQHIPCDDVLVAVGQENSFPWIERDIGIEFDKWDMPKVDPKTMRSTHPKVFFGGDAAFGPKNIIWAVAHGHEAAVSIDMMLNGEDIDAAPVAGGRGHQPEDGHPRVELRQRDFARPALPGAAARQGDRAADIKAEVELGFDSGSPSRRPSAASTATCRRCSPPRCASNATPASTSARWTASPSRRTLRKPICAGHLQAPAPNLTQDIYVANGLKTGRIMAKDEDVCLHCGLCAERCPTGAWDMKKYLIDMTYAGNKMPARSPIGSVNDFVVRFANVNGSGSASANELFARAVLRMGVPVSSRNIFPSNIQGLPTWFEVRVCEAGHLGARGGIDLMVAMNPQTWDKDVAGDRARRLPVLRFDQADAGVEIPRRHRGARRAAHRDLQSRIHRSAPAPAVQEHHLSRRARRRCSTSSPT